MTGAGKWSLALVAVTAVWGWSFAAIHDALARIAPSTFVAYRFAIAALLLALFSRMRGLTRKEALAGLVAGAFLGAGFAMQTFGLLTASPSNSGFITGMTVVFIPVVAFFALRARLGRAQLLAIVLAVTGLGLLTLRGLSVSSGDLWTLGCAVAFSCHVVALGVVNRWGNILRITVVQLVVAAVLGLVWAAVSGDAIVLSGDPGVWAALAVTATAGTAVAYLVQARAQTMISASRVALIFAAEPVFAAGFGYWLAGDRFTALNMLGGVLVLAAMLVSEFGGRDSGSDQADQYVGPVG
ncbi:MAG: DMT family transporter [Segniliparus sp.]|uniref:DMT family transporter n=1 Tax=Segniliparus sp. TaxID=2804064 RepID=UPI003F2F1B4A